MEEAMLSLMGALAASIRDETCAAEASAEVAVTSEVAEAAISPRSIGENAPDRRSTFSAFRASMVRLGHLGSAAARENRMADHDALVALHTALIDTRTGYGKALRDADDPSIRPILQNVHDLHGQAHADVHAMLTAAGLTPDESGSFMSTVHETVIGVRSAVVGLDAGALSSFASGEESNLAKYDEAIKAEPANATSLTDHRAKLAQAVEAMKREAA